MLPVPLITPDPNNILPPVMLPATLSAVPDVLAIDTKVLAENVTVPLPAAVPILMLVIELATPFSPILMVFVLPVDVAPLARYNICVPVDLPRARKPVCAVPPTVQVPVVIELSNQF